MGTNERLHRLKSFLIRSEWLRHQLRSRVLAPYQYLQLRRIVDAFPVAEPPRGNRPRILILGLRHWAISRAWETVFSRTLMQEGCHVTWLVCDRALLRCDGMLKGERDLRLCSHCYAFNHAIADIAGVERLSLASLPCTGASTALDRARRGELPEELERAIGASFQRILGTGRKPPGTWSVGERRIHDELLASAANVQELAGEVLDRTLPSAVLALNGKFFAEALILAEARRRGIAVWTYERGNRRNTVALSKRPVAIPFDMREDISSLRRRPITDSQRKAIRDYLGARGELGNGQVRFLARDGQLPVEVAETGGRVVALFTNLIWDSSVVGEDTIFPDMFSWLEATVRTLADQPSTRLVIRVHPAEVRVYWHPTRQTVEDVLRARWPQGLPRNVTLVRASDPVDSYRLARRADLVVVYASTIGMEASAMGKRVVVAANTSFAAAPFVVRPNCAAAYFDEIRSERSEPPVPDAVDLAERYMYRLYCEAMLAVPGVMEDPTGFRACALEGDTQALRRRFRSYLRDMKRGERSLP